MLKLGYSCKDFINLSDSFLEGHSQEVLLAAGWLISTQEIIDKLFFWLFNSYMDNEYIIYKNYQVSVVYQLIIQCYKL